ncbi:MAG: hypothetical protein GF400_07095, partial [Candidatus Eisenbacteria bacterium]|nr:hypothetical protein [Candidatus Eisenbacteria bacterium]
MRSRNFKLVLEYDGTDFAGWQVQPGLRTVQGVLEETIGDLLVRIASGRSRGGGPVGGGGEDVPRTDEEDSNGRSGEAQTEACPRGGEETSITGSGVAQPCVGPGDGGAGELARDRVSVTGAGRTDAGVHALGQVASVRVSVDLDPDRLTAALNARLPDDLIIKETVEVAASFNARFSATSRRYLYLLSGQESPIWRKRRWYVRYDLDAASMKRAAQILEGEHDFSSFCISGSEPDHHRCRVDGISLEWEAAFGGVLAFRIEANRFLRGMVRSIVGTLVDVGRGRIAP